MKPIFLFLSLVFCLLILGSGINAFAQTQDATKNEKKLVTKGADVYEMNKLLSRNEVEQALKDKPASLALYQKGRSLRSTGNGLLIGGIVGTVGGIVIMVSGIDIKNDYNGHQTTQYNSNYVLGALLSAVGEGMIAGGIVCKIVGKRKIINSINSYNNSAYINQPSQYNLTFGV